MFHVVLYVCTHKRVGKSATMFSNTTRVHNKPCTGRHCAECTPETRGAARTITNLITRRVKGVELDYAYGRNTKRVGTLGRNLDVTV